MDGRTTEHSMATLRRQIALNAPAATVWSALRDFSAVHTRVAPGFLTKLEMDPKSNGGDRIVTFFNDMVARERLVTLDDENCRLVYAVVEGRASHYNAALQVFPEGDDSRLVWTIDLLPNELAPAIGGMMDHAASFMKKTLEGA
jgi:carbon monoxide dehydrogenase subunit G